MIPADDLSRLLPEDRVGAVERVDPITAGLSGAGVYAVTASRGAFVLRIQRRDVDPASFAEQVRVLRRASDAGVAPRGRAAMALAMLAQAVDAERRWAP